MRGFIMEYKNSKKVIASVLTVMLLSISICAATVVDKSASASSTGASASVVTNQEADLLVRARITSTTDMNNDTDSGFQKSAFASVSTSGLNGTPTSSYATAWVGNDEVAFKSWSK